MNVRVEIQTVASQVNGAQDSWPKSFIYVRCRALPFRVNSGRKKIQKARVDSSSEKQFRELPRHGKNYVKMQ